MTRSYDVHYVDSDGGHQYTEFDSTLTRSEVMRECSEAAADGRTLTLTDRAGVKRTIDPESIVTLAER